MKYFKNNESGFTLIELLMAFTILSFVMLLLISGFIYTTRIYQSGVASRNTQESARLISETLTRQIRTASRVEATGGRLCVVNINAIVFEVDASDILQRRVLPDSNCASLGGSVAPLTTSDVRVRRFEPLILSDTTGNAVSVELTFLVTSPDVSLLDANSRCSPVPGFQFCSSTLYFNAISLRNEES